MTHKTKGIIVELIIAALCIIALLTVLCSGGCAINSSKDTMDIPITQTDGTVKVVRLKSEVWQGLFLYFTSTKEIKKTTPISKLSVGSVDQYPDPNAVEAAINPLLKSLLK